jgi:CHAT domain-containing protein
MYWCPTGVFSFAPIHAAGIYSGAEQECCSDYVVSSYTPTLAALLRAQDKAKTLTTDQWMLLLVAVQNTSVMRLRPLPNVQAEVDEVTRAVGSKFESMQVLRNSSSATIVEVAKLLKSSTIAHLACHGTQHITEPLKSGFCLSDEMLTVENLTKLDLKDAFFAFLSACETAKGDK